MKHIKNFLKFYGSFFREICFYCGKGGSGEIHHCRFRSQGGGDEIENLAFLCKNCHSIAHGLFFNSGFSQKSFREELIEIVKQKIKQREEEKIREKV